MLNLYEKKKKTETFTFLPNTLKSNLNELDYLQEQIGESRHHPPANKEWYNSVYSYNKNYIKTLPIVDNIVNKLIKSYFNLTPLYNKKKSSRVNVRFKRLSLNRILVSKAEMKHSNNKVIITLYLYNRNKMYIFNKIKNIYKSIFFKNKKITTRKKKNNFIKSNKSLKLRAKLIAAKYTNIGNIRYKVYNRLYYIRFNTKNRKSLSKFKSKINKKFMSIGNKYNSRRARNSNIKRRNLTLFYKKKNFSFNFSKLTKKNLAKLLLLLQNTNLKNKYKALLVRYYSIYNNIVKAKNNMQKTSYNFINNRITLFNSRRNKNYFKLFNINKNFSKFRSKRIKSRKIKNFLYKLKSLNKLFILDNMYNDNIYKQGKFSLKKLFLFRNLYKILKKKTTLKKRDLIKKRSLIRKINTVSLKGYRIISKVRRYQNFIVRALKWNKKNFINFQENRYKNFIYKSYKKEMLYIYYVLMSSFNNNKFKNWFLIGLKNIISKIYQKKVEFNLVNLKYLHLNSDIFSQSIAIKLRNRENRLLRVLKKALKLVKLPSLNKLSFYDKKVGKRFINKYKSLNINNFFQITCKDKDVLHGLLQKIFSSIRNQNCNLLKGNSNIKSIILNSIKHKNIYGVRLEATGRLSRRLTASRSVFKLKYKGSIKNIDSSYKNLSTVMLRGNLKSNVQYTKISSKTRNGSFGLKGWVSSY